MAVLGAGGTIAPAIVRDLAESEEVGELRLLDLDLGRAEAVAARHAPARASAAAVDARSQGADGLAPALEGADVLVSSASYRVNLEAMRACLAAGCHYLDLGGLYWMTGCQLGLGAEFAEAGLLALLGMGSSPGKTNVMAVRAVRELGDAAVESIGVAAAGRDPARPAGFAVPYALETLIDEVTMAPVVIRDGAAVEIEPLAPGGTVRFAAPVGEAETVHTLHSELRTFAESFGCREAAFRLSLEPALLERLRELALAPERVPEAAAEARPASAETVSVHLVEAGAGGRSVRVSAVTEPMEEWGIGGGVVSTAAPAAAAVRLLARGRIGAVGALPPERCVEPDDLFPELERRGCRFTVTDGVVA